MPVIERPLIIIHQVNDRTRFLIDLAELEQEMHGPTISGILLSDLLDHLAGYHHQRTGHNAKDIRSQILNVMRDEDRLKEKEGPSRSGFRCLQPAQRIEN